MFSSTIATPHRVFSILVVEEEPPISGIFIVSKDDHWRFGYRLNHALPDPGS